MSRIIETKKGKYKAIVEAGKNPATGKRKRKSKTFRRKKDAKSWVADMIKEKEIFSIKITKRNQKILYIFAFLI